MDILQKELLYILRYRGVVLNIYGSNDYINSGIDGVVLDIYGRNNYINSGIEGEVLDEDNTALEM